MTAGEQADQQLLDHIRLADDGLADRLAQLAQRLHVALDVGFGGRRVAHVRLLSS